MPVSLRGKHRGIALVLGGSALGKTGRVMLDVNGVTPRYTERRFRCSAGRSSLPDVEQEIGNMADGFRGLLLIAGVVVHAILPAVTCHAGNRYHRRN